MRDLLAADEDVGTNLDIKMTVSHGERAWHVPDACSQSVASTMDVLRTMKQGESNRATAGTTMNERSSRSHSVLLVQVRAFFPPQLRADSPSR